MDGEAAAREVLLEVGTHVAGLGRVGFATVVVSDDEMEHGYAALKHEAAREVGIDPFEYQLSSDAAEREVLALLARLNADEHVDGIFVQLPLPPALDTARVLAAIDPAKDADGLHPLNMGGLLLGRPGLVPATALAILELLRRYDVELEGARAVVMGRSRYAGLPTALLLLAENATVTAGDGDITAADVLVAAAGEQGSIARVKPGATVIDASLDGAVDERVAETAGLLAPARGGVGPLTVAMLLRNTVRATRARR